MKKTLRYETIFYGISKYATVCVTLLTTSILSRILTPSEYGIVSVITVFTAFFSILADLGLGTAVIQNKTLSDVEIDDIFSFSVWMALIFGVSFALLGFPIAWFYNNLIYKKICLFLSVSVIFNAVNIIPNAILMKNKKFVLVGKRLIIAALATGAIAIIMAMTGFSYYALIFQSVFQSIFIFFWNWINTKVRFRLKIKIQSIQKVRDFSFYQFAYNFINYFARNLDNLLVGKVMGSENLAYYDKGYRLMMYPVQNLTYVINPVVHPILSEYQKDKKFIYQSYLKIVRILSLIGVFITFLCFWGSKEIILIFFGNQWNAAIPIFRMLSLSVWPQLISTSAGSIYQSTGNTKLMFKSCIVHFSITILLIIIGVCTGDLKTVALLVTASLYMRFFVDYYFLIVKNFKYSMWDFLVTFRYETVIALGLLAAIIVADKYIIFENIIFSLMSKGLVLGIVYIVMIVITGQYRNLRNVKNN